MLSHIESVRYFFSKQLQIITEKKCSTKKNRNWKTFCNQKTQKHPNKFSELLFYNRQFNVFHNTLLTLYKHNKAYSMTLWKHGKEYSITLRKHTQWLNESIVKHTQWLNESMVKHTQWWKHVEVNRRGNKKHLMKAHASHTLETLK